MQAIKLGLLGASGRMGQEIIRQLPLQPGFELIAQPSRQDGLTALANCTMIIDFSSPAGLLAAAKLAVAHNIPLLSGTTGLSQDDSAALAAAAAHIPIFHSANFSLGVALLRRLTQLAAAQLGDEFDIEILDFHHRGKRDAPSGTALALGAAAEAGRGKAGQSLPPHHGNQQPRPKGGIGYAALRGGAVVGEHAVIFAGDYERIELHHRAEQRGVFAAGALRAAQWLRAQPPGLYGMDDMLG